MKKIKITPRKTSNEKFQEAKKRVEDKKQLIQDKKQKESEEIIKLKLQIAEKIKITGFSSLDKSEVIWVTNVVDKLIIKFSEALDEDYKIYEAMLADELGYRHLNLRVQVTSSQSLKASSVVNTKMLMGIGEQLGSINERTGTNMVANMPAGIIAARTLGEQLAGDD
ncbi:hypothetical protein N9N55_03970 [Opitutales bacterium]|nr:hypothetical protein [Opitutales bacterium]